MFSRVKVRRFSWALVVVSLGGFFCSRTAVAQGGTGQQDPAQQPAQQQEEPDRDAAPSAAEKPQTDESEAKDKESGEKSGPPISVKVANDLLEFTASGTWKQVPPKSGMIEAEIKIPKLGEDKEDGRLTIMGAGGTIEANITRWQGQFAKEDGELPEVKKEVKSIADQEVHMVDISGTFLDMPGGPFAGGEAIERQGYRMLAAIIKTEKNGNYFVKLYGPQNTIEQNKELFKSMIESLKVHSGE